MECHNTHFMTKDSKSDKNYKYDQYGNIIVDTLEDLVYDNYVINFNSNNIGKSRKKFARTKNEKEINLELNFLDEKNNNNIDKIPTKDSKDINVKDDKVISLKINLPIKEKINLNILKNLNDIKINKVKNDNNSNSSNEDEKHFFKKKNSRNVKNNIQIHHDQKFLRIIKVASKNIKMKKDNIDDDNLEEQNMNDDEDEINNLNKITNGEINDYTNSNLSKFKEQNNNLETDNLKEINNKDSNEFLKREENIYIDYDNMKPYDKLRYKSIKVSNDNIIKKIDLINKSPDFSVYSSRNSYYKKIKYKEQNNYGRIFHKPIQVCSYISKEQNIAFFFTIQNDYYFCTKTTYSIQQINFKNKFPINVTSRLNKNTRQILTRIKLDNKFKPYPKVPFLFKKSVTPTSQLKNKIFNYLFMNKTRVFSFPKKYNRKSKRVQEMNRKINRYKDNIVNDRNQRDSLKNVFEDHIISLNNNKGDIININLDKIKDYFNNQDNYQSIIDYFSSHANTHYGNMNNCPLCKKMNQICQNNQDKIFGKSSETRKKSGNNNYNTFEWNKRNNKRNIKESKSSNRFINGIKENIDTHINNVKSRTLIKKSLSGYENLKMNKDFKSKKKSFNFTNKNIGNFSELFNNYTHMVNIEFPYINSYFNKDNHIY